MIFFFPVELASCLWAATEWWIFTVEAKLVSIVFPHRWDEKQRLHEKSKGRWRRVRHNGIGWIYVCTGIRKWQEAVRNVVSSSLCSVERGSSQSFLVEMCSRSWDCGFCTARSSGDKGSNCLPVSSGWTFSVARGLAPAHLGKNIPGPRNSPLGGCWAGPRGAGGGVRPGEREKRGIGDTKQSDLWDRRTFKQIGPKYSRVLDRF